MTEQSKKKKGEKGMKTVTFNAPTDVVETLNRAIVATGMNQTEIMLALVRDKLGAVVRECVERRNVAAQSFLDRGGEQGRR
jgi:hypothetical protein